MAEVLDDPEVRGRSAPAFQPIRWGLALAGEASRLPSTIGRARRLLVELPALLGQLVVALDRTTASIDENLAGLADRLDRVQASIDTLAEELGMTRSGLDELLPAVARTMAELEDRVHRMDDVLADLGGTVVGTLASVPGLRRSVRKAQGAPRPAP